MSFQSYENTVPETEINFKSLLWDLFGQWKAITLIAVLLAIALPGIKYLRDYKSYQKSLASVEVSNDSTSLPIDEMISKTLETLTDNDRPAVELLVQQQRHINDEEKYINESLLMNLDPTNLRTLSISYLLASDSGTGLSALANAYSTQLHQDDLLRSLSPLISPDSKLSYISELITVVYDPIQDNDIRQIPLTVSVVLPEGADAQAVGSCIDSYIHACNENIQSGIGTHTIHESSRTEQSLYNEVVRSRKAALLNDINSSRTTVKTNYTSLSSEQKNAFTSISDSLNAAQDIDGQSADDKSETADDKSTAIDTKTPPSFSVKYSVLGFLLGILIYVVAYVAIVSFAGRLSSAESLCAYTGCRLLGSVYYPERYSGISNLFHSTAVSMLRYKDRGDVASQLSRIALTIESVCDHYNSNSIHIFRMNGIDNAGLKLAEDLVTLLKAHDVSAHIIDASTEMNELELLSVQSAVFFASDDVQSSEAWNVSALCRGYDIVPMGNIYIRKW